MRAGLCGFLIRAQLDALSDRANWLWPAMTSNKARNLPFAWKTNTLSGRSNVN
jgi:hypothetical protein